MKKLLVAVLLWPLFAYAATVEGPAPGETRAGVNNAANVSNGKLWVQGDSSDADAGVTVVEQGQFDYETVAASQTDQALGNTGGVGDFLHKLVIVPATTSPGNVLIEDGTGSAITVFTGGASSVGDLTPIVIEFNIRSTDGAWEITTGANVSVLGIGRFTP